MKLAIIILVFIFFVTSSASALEISEYNVTFVIMPDTSVRENVSMAFRQPINASSLNYMVLGEISGLQVTDGERNIEYVLEKTDTQNNARFVVPEGTRRLEISFTAHDLVFRGENVYSFSAGLTPPASDSVNVYAYLPEGFAIYRNVIYPQGYETLTDGKIIYLKWAMEKPESIMVSFKFYNTNSDYSLAVTALMGIALVVVVAYLVGHYRKKMKSEFERGFSEDERKVLFILSREKRVMQNKIEKELHFSRAKMTRLVKKLEAKGLVEKERVGRTNRLFYKKT
jgi:uncharacterized membrane protein